MFRDEHHPFNGMVQTSALRLIQARRALRLIIRERKETDEKEERSDNEDKIYHGS